MSTDPYLVSFRPGDGFPSGVEYRWAEGSGKNSTTMSVSAPVYIEKVLQWIADQINDETKFPDDDDEVAALKVFQTPQFAALCGQIFRRLFRIYGIIYSSFFGTLEALGMAPHLNTAFKVRKETCVFIRAMVEATRTLNLNHFPAFYVLLYRIRAFARERD